MAAPELVEQDIKDGETLVRRLDEDQFAVTAAFWYYRPEDENWKLIIGSQIVGTEGPREAYRRLGKSMKRIRKSGRKKFALDSIRVELVKPNTPLLDLLKKAVNAPDIQRIRFSRNTINGVYVEDALIYRST